MLLAYVSDKGRTRPTNQDSYCIEMAKQGDRVITLLSVCDGVGGLQSGEYASAQMVLELSNWFRRILRMFTEGHPSDQQIFSTLQESVRRVHGQLLQYASQKNIRLGTTMSAILYDGSRYWIAQVGDSRIYLMRDNRLLQLTRDQTLAQRMFEQGQLTQEQMLNDRRRSVIEQCVGFGNVEPICTGGIMEKNDWVLLCSDGFYHSLGKDEICMALESASDSADLRVRLCQLIQKTRSLGETDNVSVVACKAGETASFGSSAGAVSDDSTTVLLDEAKDNAWEILCDIVETHQIAGA